MKLSVLKRAEDPLALAKLTCNETNALLQVKYNITRDEWFSLQPKLDYKPFLYLQGNKVEYKNFASVRNYEACLPRDECSEVVVGGVPTDAYEFSFDGGKIDIGQEFIYDGTNPVTATKVGTCTEPICKDTEALVEIQYWKVDYFGTRKYNFRVEDKDGDTVLSGEPSGVGGRDFSANQNQTYACLPKDDACYTFLIGSEYQVSPYVEPPPSYSVIFDGKLVRRSDSWLFDSVQFGESCKPQCNQDTESLVEVFLYDPNLWDLDYEYEYKWDLNVRNRDSSSAVAIASGEVPQGPGISPLAHKIMCVPKGSCSSFYISAPKVMKKGTNSTAKLNPVYTLTMDNVTYRKEQWWSPADSGYGFHGSDNQTTNMGSCTVGDLCDEETQDLFDLDLHTVAKYEWLLIETDEMRWNFGYTENNDWELQYLLRDNNFINLAYDIDSSYGAIECVPKNGCDLSFNITSRAPVDSYTVKKNGIQLDDSTRQEAYGNYFQGVFMTPFGEKCNKSLSGGAIAGIVIACVVAVCAIVFGLVLVWRKKRQNQPSTEGEEDPLRESLL